MSQRTATRRTVLQTTGAAAGIGALAGCADLGDSADQSDVTHTVTMEPVGEVEFSGVPETWVANNGSWADMGIALGQEPPEAVYLASRYHTQYYDEIPDVDVSKDDMLSLWKGGLSYEEFVELGEDADVFVMDPNFIPGRSDESKWNDERMAEISEVTGTPYFGNSIFSRGYDWHEYPYLSLYEAFEKLSQVFQAGDRYEAFADLHDDVQSDLESIRPPADERPSVALVWPQPVGEPEKFSPYLLDEQGTSAKQWRDLGVEDAFATADVRDFHSTRGRVDYETLLEIDPDVILVRGNEAKTATEFADTVLAHMEDHNSASELTAVRNGDVYRGGSLYQGPITNLVLTERAARQVYDYDGQLYDRQRVSDIVNGEF